METFSIKAYSSVIGWGNKEPCKGYFHAPIVSIFIGKVEELKNQVNNLTNQRNSLKHSVDTATRQGDEINDDVQNWLSSVDKAIEEAEVLVNGEEQVKERCFLGLIPNLKKRYQLSKKAEKKAQTVDTLRKEGRFDRISYRPLLQPIMAPSVYNNEVLHSRIFILEKVMDALMNPGVNTIGVYGMGGVGKTTLAKEVHRKAIEDKLFNVVVMVAVSDTPDVRKIQGRIADAVQLTLKEESEDGRADRLHQRLLRRGETILVILDDIWEPLELKKVGIPSGMITKDVKYF
ncbi:hypothetical protein GH714_010229 [Hevea brasiliensis]|uniref:NB-ARC domain-containing protein n=1 Tax=Hevea brasiliensis TaxID=3981 RepID=A0A6A6N231_HEVBR|nr:hypothetical protein GH714_010229 [Hevea brasiliensis]